MPIADWAAEVLEVWFGTLGPGDWFGSSARIDDLLKSRFANVLNDQAKRDAGQFLTDPDTARSAIILFDQVPRNIHRDSPRAFAYDPLALDIAKAAMEQGWDKGLSNNERQFIAMPLMHSEALADQDASLAYFTQHLPDNVPFAKGHRDAIARFGRFPHRNEILGRGTTPAEAEAIAAGMKW